MTMTKIEIMYAINRTIIKSHVSMKVTILEENMRRIVNLDLIENIDKMKSLVIVLI